MMVGNASGPTPRSAPAAMRCRVCHTEVPTAAFCGVCGATLFHLPGNGPDWLRVRAHAAAPEEQVPRLSVVTTLFPQLSPRSRPAFRTGLAALVIALVVLALGHWQAALVAVSGFGVWVLFSFYVRRCGAARDQRPRLLAATLIGAAAGIAFTLLTGPLLAGPDRRIAGLAVPLIGALLMLAPAALLRVLRPPSRESLDGYLIGAAGALAYTAAAVLTRTAPQLTTGLVAGDRPTGVLLTQGLINGLAMPVTAAAVGGITGAALWFTARHRPRRAGRGVVVLAAVALYGALALVDTSRPAVSVLLGWHLLVAAIAVLALRATVHLALLHEAPEDEAGDAPVLCTHCRHVVPEMTFCPNCGVAHRASPRSVRAALRAAGAVEHDDGQFVGDPHVAALFPGYANGAAAYTAPLPRDTSRTRLLLSVSAVLAVAVAVVAAITVGVTPAPASYACPPDCGRPPIRPPVGDEPGQGGAPDAAPPSAPRVAVHTFPRYTSADGKFSVTYFPAADVSTATDGVILHYPKIFDGEIRLFETPAHHRTPLQIVRDYIADHSPTAKTDYEIPNAMVGYEPGYGEVDDVSPDNPYATYRQGRLLVMAAVKNGLALVATAEGPKVVFTHKNSDHPSAVNLMIAQVLGASVNSFTWNEGSQK